MAENEHPIKLAAIAVVGTLGVCTAVGSQWVLPTMTAHLTHENDLLKQKLEKATEDNNAQRGLDAQRLRDLQGQLDAEDAKLMQRSAQISEMEKKLHALQTLNMFMKGDAYPIGLDQVRLGDPSTKVMDIFKGDQIRENRRALTVVRPGELFRDISFRHSTTKETQGKVESIRFSYNALARIIAGAPKLPDGWLESILKKALGDPRVIGEGNDCLLWFMSDKELVYYRLRDDGFQIGGLVAYPAGCWVTDEQLQKYGRKR